MKRVFRITGFSEDIACQSLKKLGLSEKSVEVMMKIWPRTEDGLYKPLVGAEADEFYESVSTLLLTDSASSEN